jgi:hypothetical protein
VLHQETWCLYSPQNRLLLLASITALPLKSIA